MRVFPLLLALMLFAGFALAGQPVGDRLSVVIQLGLSADPERKNKAFGTSIEDALDTDLASGLRTNTFTQLVVVSNLDTSTNVCIGSLPWTATGSTCNDKCGTAANWPSTNLMNCTTNSADMGSVVTPGASREFRYDGTRCLCAVASGAGTDVQIERVVR